jgi:outer membrane immunogenic protein
MNRHFVWALASIISLGAAGQAMAADMAVKAPPMAAPAMIYNWTGGYVGLNAGGVFDDSRIDVYPTGCFLTSALCGGGPAVNPIRSDSIDMSQARFTGGGQAGYNWQRERYVFGVEGDINWTGINDSAVTTKVLAAPLVGSMVHAETLKQDWLATIRGRVGYTVTPAVLLYATGGLAVAHVQTAAAIAFTATPDTYAGSSDQIRAGWTVGGGGEWMVAKNWSVKAEYLYVDLGKVGTNQACTTPAACSTGFPVLGGIIPAPGGSYQADFHVHEHIVRAGVNYHFGAPVVAKY